MSDVEVSIFSIPKSYLGHTGVIQRNALKSWCVQADVEVILLGDDRSVEAEAEAAGAKHLSGLQVNEHGTPLLDSAFALARKAATGRLLCFINADILLPPDFTRQLLYVTFPRFLLLGARCDLEVTGDLDMKVEGWFENIRSSAKESGDLGEHFAVDYFVFPRALDWEMPPFAVGRTIWDNWLVYRAKSMRLPVVDASPSILAVHQSHDYSHIAAAKEDVWKGPEAIKNQRLSGDLERLFGVFDATHVLKDASVRRAHSFRYLRQRLLNRPILSSWARGPYRRILYATRRIRGLQT